MAGTKMGVVGCGGRMGRMLVAEIVASEGCALAGGCAKPGTGYINQDIGELAGVGRLGISVGDSTEKLIRDSDVVIEFTTPAATATHAAQAAGLGKAMVIGTTGLSVKESDGVRQASRRIPIVWAPNMSLGINLLLGLVEDVARRLGPEWDVEIMEMHHRGKVDAPSGTALMLGEAAAAGRGISLRDHSARGRDGITGARRARRQSRCRRRSQRDLPRSLRAPDAVASRRGTRAVRPWCAEGGAVGARPESRSLFDGRRARSRRRLN